MLNFKISELTHSNTAINHKINNMPDINSLDCMLDLIVNCLQPIRDLIQKPMIITSGYRNPRVNQLLKGVSTSQHCLGQAADFQVNGMKPSKIVEIIKNSSVEFDQLINEYDRWVHVSFVKGKNRRQVLRY